MCDSFVALPGHTADGSLLFGKNSDRQPNEAQSLEYHPPREHPAGTRLRCTHISIDEVRRTNGVLLSRPYWTWGAEMGVNQHGLVVGNEAVFTRLPRSAEPGLIGMDLLRLALERASSAHEGLRVITELLARHGQGGDHGGRLVYHNSFLLADPGEAWVLETAGPLWAAQRVKGFAALSNGLTVGEEIDEAHPRLGDEARRLGQLRDGRPLHFARCFSDRLYTTLSACRTRRARTLELLSRRARTMEVRDGFSVLRDHGEAGLDYRPDRHLLMRHACAHAGNGLTRDAAQSTGSLVVRLHVKELSVWATATSAPCLSLFKPVWLKGAVLPPLGPLPGPAFDAASLWWRHERVHRLALRDLPGALRVLAPERDALEQRLLDEAGRAEADPAGRFALTEEAFRCGDELDERLLERFARELRHGASWPPFQSYWRKRNRQAGLAS